MPLCTQGGAVDEGYTGQPSPSARCQRPRSGERSEGSLDQRASEGATMGQRLHNTARGQGRVLSSAPIDRTQAVSVGTGVFHALPDPNVVTTVTTQSC